ncbi:MAG: sulfite exporter TauE/SafE family protein [Acidobacteria bacterium]|nr:sulfite exporter TauE/SafE family protein [Acidobacteriota bacterium]
MVSVDLIVATVLALLIGLSLGAVGGGGSILAVPVLVGVVGLTAEQATASSLVVVGIASLVGVVTHARAGRVDLRAGLGFAVAGIAGSFVGTRLNEGIDGDVLLLGFAALMVLVGTRMLQSLRRPDALPVDDLPLERLRPDPVPVERPSTLPRYRDGARLHRYVSTPDGAGAAVTIAGPTTRPAWDGRRVALLIATGTGVGFLTGLFGVGGGFVIVPALVLVLGFPMTVATGTSLLVIALNAGVALAFRGGVGAVDWAVVAPFTAAAVLGVLAGRAVADRVPTRHLTAALGLLVLAVAVWTGIDAAVALAAT